MGIIEDIDEVVKLLESYRSRCSGPCSEIDDAVDRLREVMVKVGAMLDFISMTYSESQRLLSAFFTTRVNVESGLLRVIMNGNSDEYLDDMVKRLNVPPDRLIKVLEVLKSSGLVDYTLRYDNGVKVLVRRIPHTIA